MARPALRKPAFLDSSTGTDAVASALNSLASHLAEFIISLEAERREHMDAAVLSYVHDAVAAEINHRRHERQLAGALASIETQTTASAAPGAARIAPGTSGPQRPPLQAPAGSDLEDAFYRTLVAEQAQVHVRCLDGYDLPSAVIRSIGTSSLLIETANGTELLLKRSVISIVRR